MRFQPRHYLLIAIIVALGIWNWVRVHRAHEAPATGPKSGSPAWQAYDKAAGLRDAPEGQFTPAMNELKSATDAAPPAEAADLRGCAMWLGYYRHSAPTASGKSADWSMLATSHVQSCLANHRDIGR